MDLVLVFFVCCYFGAFLSVPLATSDVGDKVGTSDSTCYKGLRYSETVTLTLTQCSGL